MLELMIDLAKQKDTCVLATLSESAPHCSLMAYATNEDCSEIYMTTLRDTQKFRNVIENPSVSLLIDNRDDHPGPHRSEARALTVSGTCEIVEDETKHVLVREKLLARNAHLKLFLERPDAAILYVRVASFLLLDKLTDAHYQEL